jgi:hypothetical protein
MSARIKGLPPACTVFALTGGGASADSIIALKPHTEGKALK